MSVYSFEEEEFSSKFNGKTLRRMVGQLLPYWKGCIVFLITVATVSVMEAMFTYVGKMIIDQVITPGDSAALPRIMGTYIFVAMLSVVSVFIFIMVAGRLGQRVQYDLRKQLFNKLQDLSFSYFDRTPVGWIMSRVTSDTERIADLITFGMLDVVWATMNVTVSMLFMVTINWQLTLLVLALFPILLYVALQFRTRILAQYREVRKTNSKITGSYNENITGVRVVKALAREGGNLQDFGALTAEMYKSSFRAAWLSAMFMPCVQVISALAVGVIVWYGGSQVNVGGMTIGGIQAFIGYIAFMMWPILDLSRVFADMQQAIASAERMYSLIDAQPEIVDRPGAIAPDHMRGEIEFDHVKFYYEVDKPVIDDLSFKIKQGETIAIVGATGGGKSTIVNLICRFYEPKDGVIRIGGRDYTTLTMKSIQSRIGIVLQTPRLFSGNIRENIRYGRLDATNEEIEDAAKLAGAHDFIANFAKGYDEEVGEGGNLLSVGQKQLISLARAVLAKPDIFIMDEATSSVDTLTEALIQRGMESLMHGRTSFIIAHRLSTIRRANRIMVIEKGQIQELGSHAELMRAKGHYYRLYTKQFREEREAALNPFAEHIEKEDPEVLEATA